MPGYPRKAHDEEALREAVVVARAAAAQLKQTVFVQRATGEAGAYPVRLHDRTPANRKVRNVYAVAADGAVQPFPHNPPYREEV